MDIPRFKALNIEQGKNSVVGNCNGFSCEDRWRIETPAFARAILSHLPANATAILDYGVGVGRLAKEVLNQNKKVTVIGVDASDDELRLAKEYIQDSRFGAIKPENIPHKVDLIYCVYVLQHIPAIELRHAIERMHYFLKPGGKLVYCSSDYRMAVNSGGGFTDDRHLGVDIRKELSRLFDEESDLFPDLSNVDPLIKGMVTAEGCPNGSIPHPAKVYKRKEWPSPTVLPKYPYFMAEFPAQDAKPAEKSPKNGSSPAKASKDEPRRLILKNRQSPGDILVMTAAIRSLHKAYPGRFITDVESPVGEIFENSPYITKLNGQGDVIDMHYPLISDCEMRGLNHVGSGKSGRHFSDGHRKYLEDVLEIEIPRTGLVPDIFLNQDEMLWPSPVLKEHGYAGRYWVLNAGSKSDFTLKQYHRYQEVVDLLKDKIKFVQIGDIAHNHPPLNGVLDLRGKTGHRELFRTIFHAEGVLTCVSYPMHIAAAFMKPCVVVAGGREGTRWELYPNHRFIHSVGLVKSAQWDGCWKSRLEECVDVVETDKGKQPRCMEIITPEKIADELMLYYKGGILEPLPVVFTPSKNGKGKVHV